MMPQVMRRSVVLCPATILASGIAFSAPPEVSNDRSEIAHLLALGGDGFRIHDTEHFLIVSDANDALVKPLGDRLEATYRAVARFCEGMKFPIHRPDKPLPVLMFSRYSDFMRYAKTVGSRDAAVPGFYIPENNTVALCNLLDFPELRDVSERIEQAEAQRDSPVPRERITEWRSQRDAIAETFNQLVIQHEAAHQVLFNTGVLSRNADNPDWLVEGLACQFEVPSPDAVNQPRLADFRDAIAAKPEARDIGEADLRAAQADGRFLSLVDLIADKEFNVADQNKRTSRYAQAWAFMDYLHRARGDALAAYLRRLPIVHLDQQQRIAEFEAEFGKLDLSFERAWINSVLALPFDPRQARR